MPTEDSMRYLPLLVFVISLAFPSAGESVQSSITTTIDRFVSNLYPKGSQYFWVINNTTTDSPEEMMIDINTSVRIVPEESPSESRFLLLVIKGELFAAQKIPLDATVDCDNEEEKI
jgi:hypothetical protein